MKKIFFICALLITLCANTIAQETCQHRAHWSVSAMTHAENLTYLRDFSVKASNMAVQPYIEGSLQYREVKASLGVVVPTGAASPLRIEAGFYLATPNEKNWQVYGGFTAGARNKACDALKKNYTPTQGVFEGMELYLPDYIFIQDWTGEAGIRVGYAHKFSGGWAFHATAGWNYSIGITERPHILPEWARKYQDTTIKWVLDDMRECIPPQYVKDTALYIRFGLAYYF